MTVTVELKPEDEIRLNSLVKLTGHSKSYIIRQAILEINTLLNNG